MAEIRCYLVIDGAAPRAVAQWQLLINGLKTKPMSAALIEKARSSPYNTVNINRLSLDSRYMLGDFEMREADHTDLLAVLEAQRIAHGVADGLSARETFRQVFLAEIRAVAIAAGYGGIAPSLGVEIIGFGPRQTAIDDAQVWLADHKANWEPEV